jgi:hypothetical protein
MTNITKWTLVYYILSFLSSLTIRKSELGRLFTVYCLLFTVYCLLLTVYCLLLTVYSPVSPIHRFTSRRAMTLLEIMGMMFIVSVWLLTVWQITHSGQRLADNTENRIKAINLAREWLEAVTNIRDTNWIKFPGGKERCWNVLDYETDCMNSTNKPRLSGSYIPYLSGSLWYVNIATNTTNTGVYMNGSGFPYQTSATLPSTTPRCTVDTLTGCVTRFSRTVTVSPDGNNASSASGMTVTATITWRDQQEHSVTLSTYLTNWSEVFSRNK